MTIYKQVPIEEELPPIGEMVIFLMDNPQQRPIRSFIEENGEVYYSETKDFKYWLKPIALPTEEEINKSATLSKESIEGIEGFIEGANHIINQLK